LAKTSLDGRMLVTWERTRPNGKPSMGSHKTV